VTAAGSQEDIAQRVGAQLKSQFKLVKSFEYHPSPFVWRDERGDFERKEVPREMIELYEFLGEEGK
jgi:hypothetical protein